MNPIVHTDDPESSVAAALSMITSGRRASNADILRVHVIRHPGLTAGEYSRMTGMEVHEVRRRLTDLKARGMAYQGETRPCLAQGTSQCEWWPVEST